MRRPRSRVAFTSASALGLLLMVGACQQILGVDDPTLPLDRLSRICECPDLLVQGPAFAGSADAACEVALATQPDTVLLATAEGDCTDCDNVRTCYDSLTEAGEPASGAVPADACNSSPECSSWVCCQGVVSVQVVLGAEQRATLVSDPVEASCCTTCVGCQAALDALGSDGAPVACAEAFDTLFALTECVNEQKTPACFAPPDAACGVGSPDAACVACIVAEVVGNGGCAAEFETCFADPARPIPPENP